MPKGACVFDLDDTLTCGQHSCAKHKIEAMCESIDTCVREDMAIEVNTARPQQDNILWGIPNAVKGRLIKHDADVYIRPRDSKLSVEEQKLRHMKTIAKKWKISKKKMILFDDRLSTCTHLKNKGFKAIHVKNENGICSDELNVLKKTLRRMNA
jgi:predicted AAA+ superfamily ATPase